MDGELLRWLYHRLVRNPRSARTRRCVYGDGVVALAGLWACLNNRSLRWAADKRNWPIWCRVPRPSYSQLRRRLLMPSVAALLRSVDAELARRLGRSGPLLADGKTLPVAGHSKDPDAAAGRVRGGFARGYKLHVLRDAQSGVIRCAAVTSLNACESKAAGKLLRRTPLRGVTVRADANYDSVRLYRQVASRGGRLIAPRRKPGRGLGHGPQHPDRLAAIEALERTPAGRAFHDRQRVDVERAFADLAQRVGLFALPPFVRRLRRVTRWVRAKLLLYHLTLLLRRKET